MLENSPTANIPRYRFFILLGLILATGLAVRLWIAWHYYGTHDVASWEKIFDYWRDQRSPYDAERRYSYSPIWFWILSFTSRLNVFFNFPPHFAVKLPSILADLLILFVLLKFATSQERSLAERLGISAVFFLNPVSILNTSYHGQFDNIVCLLCLLACYFEGSTRGLRRLYPALLFSLGAAVKHWLFLLAPVFVFRQKNRREILIFLAIAPGFFLLALLPYFLSSDPYVFSNVLTESTVNIRIVPGHWGWPLAINQLLDLFTDLNIRTDPRFAFLSRVNFFLYPACLAMAYYLARKGYDLIDSVIIYLLFFYTFTVFMAPQYTVWILPFAALKRSRFIYLYSVFTGVHLVAFYVWSLLRSGSGNIGDLEALENTMKFFRTFAWLVAAFWLAENLKSGPVAARKV